MKLDAIPTINTDELPVPEARDDAWRSLGKCPLVATEDGYAVTSRSLAETVLRNPAVFSSQKAFDTLGSPVPLVPVAFDPPQQTRYRRLLQPFFSPRVVKPLEDSLRKQIVELIDPLLERGHCEFISEVASVFPVQVFLTVFGLPLEMRDQFIEWKDAVLDLTSASGSSSDAATTEAGMQKALELFVYLTELIKTRRGAPGDDVLSQVLALEPPDELTDEEAVGLCFLFVLAGLDTVTDALGFGLQRLAENPDKRQQIVDDPTLIYPAAEELLRLDPPAPFLPRVTTGETSVGGTTCPVDTRLTVHLAVANRDETVFPNPYEIDFQRPDNAHISFGMGAHRCLGSHLARLQLNVVYEEWHRRIPHYHITPGTTPLVHWPRGTTGLDELHLTFGRSDAQ